MLRVVPREANLLLRHKSPPEIVVDRAGVERVVTGFLTDAEMEYAFGKRFLVGNIYHDTMGRFADGARIHTSWVHKEIAPDVFLTRSENVYRVRWKQPLLQRDSGDETTAP